jgi:hypothetical protein
MKALADLVQSLLAAMALGAVLAFLPGRVLPLGRRLSIEVAQSVMLLTVASAMAQIVIGDQTARAFALVGLGAFIRFRTPLKDPRDSVTILMGIALGMAIGVGHLALAAAACAMFTVLLGAIHGRGSHLVLLRVDCDEPLRAAPAARAALEKLAARVVFQDVDSTKGRLRVRVETAADPSVLGKALAEAVPGSRKLRWEIET